MCKMGRCPTTTLKEYFRWTDIRNHIYKLIKSFDISSLNPGRFRAFSETISTFLPSRDSRASDNSEYRYSDGDLNLISKSTSLSSLCSPRATLPNRAMLSIPYFSAFSFLKVRRDLMMWSRSAINASVAASP